ncbi:hypothetical protein PR048_014242 [Dryococelus australis]|uniref:LRRNT domain-containing protein n=1 Tax=Dryococelus australis TaxID=614101 RepID=A0ABQ9HDS3_9NEOP|nr:hypothetical protein PR048_014242 [Dryococelus australis]
MQEGARPSSIHSGAGGGSAVILFPPYQGAPDSIPGQFTPDFRKGNRCRTMPLVDGFSLGSPVSPRPFHSGAAPYSPRFTNIGPQDLAVKSRPNPFTHILSPLLRTIINSLHVTNSHKASTLKEWACPEGSFKCRNGPCINSSLVCNENADCPSTWVDEDNCAFLCSNHEPRCLCRDTQINCTGLGLKQIPPDIEEEITWLDLSNNSITSLPPLAFRNLWRLHVLNLQNNRIHTLQNGSFTGLPNLRGL